MDVRGRFTFEQVRNGVVIARDTTYNTIITDGIAKVLDAAFGGATAVNPWYIGLINNSPTPTLLTTDTLASHSGWSELVPSTDYTGNRKEWVDAATSGRTKGTTSVASFTILTTQTIYGMFVCSVASGTTGYIWSEGAYDAVKPVVASDVINATYEIEIA